MTTRLRNILLVLAVLLFGGVAIYDFSRRGSHDGLQDCFVGAMICFLILRVSRLPRRPASTPE